MSGAPGYPKDARIPQYAVVEVVALSDAQADACYSQSLNKRGAVTGAVLHCGAYLYDVHFFEPNAAASNEQFWAEELAPIALPLLLNDRAALCALLLACHGLLDAANPMHLAAARVDARKALAQLNHMETPK